MRENFRTKKQTTTQAFKPGLLHSMKRVADSGLTTLYQHTGRISLMQAICIRSFAGSELVVNLANTPCAPLRKSSTCENSKEVCIGTVAPLVVD